MMLQWENCYFDVIFDFGFFKFDGLWISKVACSQSVVGLRSTAEAVEQGKGNYKEDHMVGFVRVLGEEIPYVAFL